VTSASETAKRRITSTDVFCVVLLAAVLVKLTAGSLLDQPSVAAWTTVFAAICIQASPFLALGIAISTLIAVFVPTSFFDRALPARASLAVPVAAIAGLALPGCECGSVPVSAALVDRGVARGPAMAFLLSAPAINPVVLVATSIAFPGRPVMVLARLLASLLTSVVVGWLWQRAGRSVPLKTRRFVPAGGNRWDVARQTATHDLAQSLGLLCIGAASAAFLNVAVPRSWLDGVAGNAVLGVLALSVLAVLLAVCSEADAFIASSLTQFSLTARLAFMVVGPAVDVKLIALQTGTFGRRFTQRFAPLAFCTAVGAATVIGTLLL
jgi:uncharacterized protein